MPVLKCIMSYSVYVCVFKEMKKQSISSIVLPLTAEKLPAHVQNHREILMKMHSCSNVARSIFDLWPRPWGVARLLGLRGVPPRPHSFGMSRVATPLLPRCKV